MHVERVVVGKLRANCYVATKDDKCIIVDPGAEPEKIIDACKGKEVVGILVTHHHFDHVDALDEIEEYYNIKASIEIEEFNMEVIKTPGHASDCLTYYFPDEKVMFTGDFLFKGTIGRTDLPTSSVDDMKNSLDIIKEYPSDVKIYPGHGIDTILGAETPLFDDYLK